MAIHHLIRAILLVAAAFAGSCTMVEKLRWNDSGPSVTVLYPLNGQVLQSNYIAGTAVSSNDTLEGIYVAVGNEAFQRLPGASNWQIGLNLLPGDASIHVYAKDSKGRTSPTNELLVSTAYRYTCTFGGAGDDAALALAYDSAGSAYLAGYFWGTVDFDPTAGSDLHVASGSDAFLVKILPDGSYGWMRTIGAGASDWGNAVACDGKGCVAVGGSFSGAVDFDPGVTLDFHDSVGASGAFVSRYSNNGAYLWTWSAGASNAEASVASAACMPNGDIVLAGSFSGAVDFNALGAGDVHISAGSNDAFVALIRADGAYGFTRTFGGTGDDSAEGVAVDASGNIVVAGSFSLSADLNPGAGIDSRTSAGSWDAFTVKLDSGGTFLWAKTFGGFGSDGAHHVAVDSSGNIAIAGSFEGAVSFDAAASETRNASGSLSDAFVVKLRPDGGYLWTRANGGTGLDQALSVCSGPGGEIFAAGVFEQTVNFRPGGVADNRTASGKRDVFLSAYGTLGDSLWTKTVGGLNIDQGHAVAAGPGGAIGLAGNFESTVDFDPAATADSRIASGWDVFYSKYLY